ncbi:MAG: hypothetical protein R6W91_05130 [Thermoplasmata archaeon]
MAANNELNLDIYNTYVKKILKCKDIEKLDEILDFLKVHNYQKNDLFNKLNLSIDVARILMPLKNPSGANDSEGSEGRDDRYQNSSGDYVIAEEIIIQALQKILEINEELDEN